MKAAHHSSLASLRRRKAEQKAELRALIEATGGKPLTSKDRRNAIRAEIASIIKAAP
jgi:hypothetical protein